MAKGAGLAGRRLLVILLVVLFVFLVIVIVVVIVIVIIVVVIVVIIIVVIVVIIIIVIVVVIIVDEVVVLVVIFIRSGGRRWRGLRLSAISGALAGGGPRRLLDGDAAVLTVSGAAGDDVRIFGKGHMDDASIRGRHGVKGDGPPSPSHVIRRALGNLLQSIDVALLIPLHVDAERHVVSHCT